MEDLVEELVGDITDEYDVVTERPADNGGEVVIDGLTTLDEFADRTELDLPEGPYDTVAGFMVARLGRLAQVGDTLVVATEADESDDDDDDFEPIRFELRVAELGRTPGRGRRGAPAGRTRTRRRGRIPGRPGIPGGTGAGGVGGRVRAEDRARFDRPGAGCVTMSPMSSATDTSSVDVNEGAAGAVPDRRATRPGCCPWPSRPRTRCTWATISGRCGSGCRCRTIMTRSTGSPTCTP